MLEKDHVVFISNCIEQSASTIFEIKKLDTTVENFLPGFQKGKEAFSGYEATELNTNSVYRFIFIRSQNETYHLMIYSQNKKAIAELKEIEIVAGEPCLVWKYNPLKRDGMNQERKAYFRETFGSIGIQIKLPKSAMDTDAFFKQLFTLCQNRLEADQFMK